MHQTPNQEIVGSESCISQLIHENIPLWATGGDNGASAHMVGSAVNEYCKSGNVRVEFNFTNFAKLNSHESAYIPVSISSGICSTAGL